MVGYANDASGYIFDTMGVLFTPLSLNQYPKETLALERHQLKNEKRLKKYLKKF